MSWSTEYYYANASRSRNCGLSICYDDQKQVGKLDRQDPIVQMKFITEIITLPRMQVSNLAICPS